MSARLTRQLGAFAGALLSALALIAARPSAVGQCVDFSKDPAGCQPSTFDTPIGDMPSVRVGRTGAIDKKSSEEEARAGVALLEKKLHLFRNFEEIHWVITVPSVKDEATGDWKDGDLDAAGDGRGLGVAGTCIFVGHENGAGKRHAINIFKIASDPRSEERRAGKEGRSRGVRCRYR